MYVVIFAPDGQVLRAESSFKSSAENLAQRVLLMLLTAPYSRLSTGWSRSGNGDGTGNARHSELLRLEPPGTYRLAASPIGLVRPSRRFYLNRRSIYRNATA